MQITNSTDITDYTDFTDFTDFNGSKSLSLLNASLESSVLFSLPCAVSGKLLSLAMGHGLRDIDFLEVW